jgi:hypothetical protein
MLARLFVKEMENFKIPFEISFHGAVLCRLSRERKKRSPAAITVGVNERRYAMPPA